MVLAAIRLGGHLRLRVWFIVGIQCLVISPHEIAVTAHVEPICSTFVHVPPIVLVEMCAAVDAFDGSLTRDISPSGGMRSTVIFSHDSLP